MALNFGTGSNFGFGGAPTSTSNTTSTGFSFGSPAQQQPQQTSFGTATQQQPQQSSFGTPTQQPQQQPSFGGFGGTNTTQSNFGGGGSFSFGNPTAAVGQSSFSFAPPNQSTNFSMGNPTTSAPSFSFSTPTACTGAFGQPPATSAPNFSFSGFGSQPQTSGFGSTQQTGFSGTQPTGFGTAQPPGFGGTQPTGFGTAQPTGFGTAQPTGFGAPLQTPAFGGVQTPGFGAVQPSGFGALQTSGFGGSQPPGFGAGQTPGFGTSQQSGFGTSQASAFGAAQPTGFGATQPTGFGTSQPSAFGGSLATGGFGGTGFSGFGNTPVGFAIPKTTSAFSFSTPTFGQPQTSLFAQQPPQQHPPQQQPLVDESQAFYQSIFQCSKFGDERDGILANLNYLQACWGAGKGHYSQTFAPVAYAPTNPFYRFKAVGYSFVYTDTNEDGQVVICIKKTQDKIQAEETQMISALQTMVGRPNILFKISGIKPSSEESTNVIIFAEDRGNLRRIPATELAGALTQPYLKNQLDNLSVINISPKVRPSPEQLKRYLEYAPDGIDPRVWRQAQDDNPDPNNMIPITIMGIDALKKRAQWQESETQQHQARLQIITEEISTLLNRHTNMNAELQQLRRKQAQLSHRLLCVILRQEMMRKQGVTIQQEELVLRKEFEALDSDLNSPTQYKGRLNELLSQIRLQKSSTECRALTRYSIDPTALPQIKEFLAVQQESMKHLVDTIKIDLEQLKLIMLSISDMTTKMPQS